MKEELLKKYNEESHYQIPCFLDNPVLSKLLTGEGASVARELYKDYVYFDATLDADNKYKIWEVASKINSNPAVHFFTCVGTDLDLGRIHVELWGDEQLLVTARLIGDNGNILLDFLLDKSNK